MHELDKYDFHLPKALIAQTPANPRESARLLVYERKSGRITDDYFFNLLDYLPAETTLVLNNSKVEKARLKFGKREVFLTKSIDANTVEVLVYPGKQFSEGKIQELAPGIQAEVLSVLPSGQRILRFSLPLSDKRLDKYRHTPFPPYIKSQEKLASEYQTVYAKALGSKAAPTAGLHFSREFLKKVKQQVSVAEITLHVGLGTFAPLKEENLRTGRLHEEVYAIDETTSQQLNNAKHVTAVGTTTLRALESNKQESGFRAGQFNTDIFIRPGYEFQAADALITNFHLPKSSLLMLVAALVGEDEWRDIYEHAIAAKYRFYSFGDAMLVL